jgi:hypothetical protein
VSAVDRTIESPLLGAELALGRGPVSLRLRRLAGRWLATAIGPRGEVEVGADASPYLAAQLALETWQPDAVSVLLAVTSAEPVAASVPAEHASEQAAEPEPAAR